MLDPRISTEERLAVLQAENDKLNCQIEQVREMIALSQKAKLLKEQPSCVMEERIKSSTGSAAAATSPVAVTKYHNMSADSANLDHLFSDGNEEPPATAEKQRHHSKPLPTGKNKSKKRVATRKPAKIVRLESTDTSDASSVAEMGAATASDLRSADSDSSIEQLQQKLVQQTLARDFDPCESCYLLGELHKDVPAVLLVVDTGSMVSMISKNVFDKIPVADQPDVRENSISLKSVTI